MKGGMDMASDSRAAKEQVTSEQIHGVPDQPPPTCPLVDKAIQVVEQIQRDIKGFDRADESELRDMLSWVDRWLADLVGYRGNGMLEDIRTANSKVREWGQGWKDLALEHVPEPEQETA